MNISKVFLISVITEDLMMCYSLYYVLPPAETIRCTVDCPLPLNAESWTYRAEKDHKNSLKHPPLTSPLRGGYICI